MMARYYHLPMALFMLLNPLQVLASGNESAVKTLDLTLHPVGLIALVIFVLAYVLVILEERLHLRKSKPVMVAAGIIWAMLAFVYVAHGDTQTVGEAFRHNLLEYAELFFFLLPAITYINTMDERGVFQVLRVRLVSSGLSLRAIFWVSGVLAFFISPVADNLTTALLMATIAMAVGGNDRQFVVVSCISVVVAANAGGAFSPFGDITTLMVWQKGVVKFHEFFNLFIPSLINWLVPAAIMSMAIKKGKPEAVATVIRFKYGALGVVALFVLTIVMAVTGHHYLHLPPVLGMMTGLGLLKFYGYHIKRYELKQSEAGNFCDNGLESGVQAEAPFNIFKSIERAEWDTLMFFYGILLCVGGLGQIGYLAWASGSLYGTLGPTVANTLIGILSAVIDNIPIMYAVLTMHPEMSHGQWLLVTLTAGVGGSLLSIGSAAGVAVMGQARGVYTFAAHFKWTWAIALGYAASIWAHMLINRALF